MDVFWPRLWPLLLHALGFGAVLLLMFFLRACFVGRRRNNRFVPWYSLQALAFMTLPSLLLYSLPFHNRSLDYYIQTLQALVTMAVDSALLWALTPLLRKRISEQGCAALWVIPCVTFYLLHTQTRSISPVIKLDPLLVIRIPASGFRVIFAAWTAGFAAVLAWKLVSHFRFRKLVLRDAVSVSAQERKLFLSTWQTLCPQEKGHLKNSEYYKSGRRVAVMRSSAVDSPLTIGLLAKSRYLVLPQREYSEQELWLIFRHESIHLLHEDNWLKLLLSFFCAAGWFIPMVWLGMGKAAEDLELCCDELATQGIGKERRRDYANLLLRNAGTARGFTTCLSASASGLRYRMARVLHPKRIRVGFLPMFLLSFFTFFLFGVPGVAISCGTVRSELLDSDGGGWHIAEIRQANGRSIPYCESDVCRQIEDAIRDLELEMRTDRQSGDLGTAMICASLIRGDEREDFCLYEKGLRGHDAYYCFTDPARADIKGLLLLLPVESQSESACMDAPRFLRRVVIRAGTAAGNTALRYCE